MNLEDRISKLEKSNKRFKVALALCLCMFMVSAKDIFIKDEIKAKKIIVDEIDVNKIEASRITITERNGYKPYNMIQLEAYGIKFLERDTNYENRFNSSFIKLSTFKK